MQARLTGDVGVVTCTENILSGAGDEEGGSLGGAVAVATNIFTRTTGGAWLLVAHHGSPVVRAIERG